ncbi:MAG TPA: hypothetical protein VD969_24575 [Symbiobacteriaceae bacterium]|nr:hypothetical protein [Symbiobacteriaceae bacterium]
MTKMWKRVAIGAAIVAAVGTITLVAHPGRLLAAGMMGGGMGNMMQSGMMGGDMSKMHDSMSGMHEQLLGAAAGALGMTADELSQALADGRGVADLAKGKGVDLAAVTGAMEDARKAAFDEMVAAGTLTQEQADQMLEHMGKAGLTVLNGAAMMQTGGACHAAPAESN